MQNDDKKNIPNVEKQGWQSEEIIEEAANKESDEITREILRGNESEDGKENADERDIAGGADSDETPHGREETKNINGG